MANYAMLTQSNCKYCTAAKGLLSTHGHTVDEYDVQDPTLKDTVAKLKKTNTVPQIYSPAGRFIGGYTELKEHLSG